MTKTSFVPYAWFLALLAISAISCDDTTLEPPAEKTGTIIGQASYTEEYGIQPNNHSGVIASISDPEISAVTNAEGWYELKNVPAGIYRIRLSKEGYTSTLSIPIQFIGADTFDVSPIIQGNNHLYKIPEPRTITLSSPEIFESGKKVRFSVSVDSQDVMTNFRVTLSTRSGATFLNRSSWSKDLTPYDSIRSSKVFEYDIKNITSGTGIKSGEHVYMIAWITNSLGLSNGLRSNEVSIVAP